MKRIRLFIEYMGQKGLHLLDWSLDVPMDWLSDEQYLKDEATVYAEIERILNREGVDVSLLRQIWEQYRSLCHQLPRMTSAAYCFEVPNGTEVTLTFINP